MKKIIVLYFILILYAFNIPKELEATSFDYVDVYIDGKLVESDPKAIIKDGRTLVPLRYVSESLGANIRWMEDDQNIYVERGDHSVQLKPSSRIINYQNGNHYGISDISLFLIDDRTFVPLRLISNALGVSIQWEDETRKVLVDSTKSSSIEAFYNISMNLKDEIIRGKMDIDISIPSYYNLDNTSLELVLLDPESYSGFIVGKANGQDGKINYIPNLNDKGDKLLLVNLYDDKKNILASDINKVKIDLDPRIGISESIKADYKNSISINPDVNFIAQSIDYIFTNKYTGKTIEFRNQDPYSKFTWTPNFEEAGTYILNIIANDNNNNHYISPSYQFNISVDKGLDLLGVRDGTSISSPVTLTASRNFNVTETQYILSNPTSNEEIILMTQGYGSYTFFPKPELSGLWDIFVRVKDTRGITMESPKLRVNIDGNPKIQVLGIGPKQVIIEDTEIKTRSNVDLKNIKYVFTNIDTGEEIILEDSHIFTPLKNNSSSWTLYAKATYLDQEIKSDIIDFKVYTKNTYGPVSIVEKNDFLVFASTMAKTTFNDIGMSASLQTAQAILETGWGQYVPRDKYSGKKSNNLFGIKGSGPNGYVISNTWEVYNGITYRVDDKFRAYNNAQESWNDHKVFLLNSERYKPVIKNMYDGYLSAWSIKTAGYATDPEYPLKLMRLMELYDLRELDRVFY